MKIPQWGRRKPEPGLAVEFALSVVQPSGERDVLTGVYSLAVAGMDEPVGRERSWLDLGVSMEQVGPLLEERLSSLDQEDQRRPS